MKKLLVILMLSLALFGCSGKKTEIHLCPQVNEDAISIIYLDTKGASLVTTTEQKADGEPTLDLGGLK